MIILGITGPIGHGKTTFAEALASITPNTKLFESGLLVAEVANELHSTLKSIPNPNDIESINQWLSNLPEIIAKVLGTKTSYEKIMLDETKVQNDPIEYKKLIEYVSNLASNPELAQQKITKSNKTKYRPLLQWLGGYLAKNVNSGIWYEELVRRIKKAENNGAKLCVASGVRFPTDAFVLRKAGGTIIEVYRPELQQSDLLDPTERERSTILTDSVIANNGNIEDLTNFSKIFMYDISHDLLKPTYSTK